MRSAPIPPTVFTLCHCGDLISAAIAPEDRTCPRDRGTVSVDITADTTVLIEALESIADAFSAPWQKQLIKQTIPTDPTHTITVQYPRRGGRSIVLNAIDAAREAHDA